MGAGLIGGVGKMPVTSKSLFDDLAIMLAMQTGGVDNWQPYSTAGTDCYVYDYKPQQDFPNVQFGSESVCEILPRGTISQTLIESYSWINACESTLITVSDEQIPVVRFYSFRGKPTSDIPLILRIWKEEV